jgi:ABC-2 type transport system ATP-binding protein
LKAIATHHLSKTYWFYEKEAGLAGSLKALLQGRKVQVQAVCDLNLAIETGELVGFIGPNGAGKTTTLKMLAGILHPTHGEVAVMGFAPTRRQKDFLKHVAFISGQRNRLFWDLPAEEYFEFCRVVYEIPKTDFEKNKHRLVELAEIGNILKVPQRKLSFGQRKRCELAAGLLHHPSVIFLDEPTNAMDLISAGKIRQFIRRLGRQGHQTVILTSHNMADIEQVCDRVIVINCGRIVFDGAMAELKHMEGLVHQIRVVFEGPWSMEKVSALGVAHELSSQEIVLEVKPQDSAAVAAKLFQLYRIKDISISEPRIETIIEKIYTRREK